MFNFNLKKSDIYLAIKWEPVFKIVKIVKKVSAILIVLFFVLFLFGFISHQIPNDLSRIFLSFFIISLVVYIAALLKNNFFESKIKNPKPKAAIKDLIANPEKYNLADFLSFESALAIDKAIKSSRAIEVTSAHIFYFLLLDNNSELNFIFSRLLLNVEDVKRITMEYIRQLPFSRESYLPVLSENFKNTILEALNAAGKRNHYRIEASDIILALAQVDLVFKRILVEFDLRVEDFENLSSWLENLKSRIDRRKRFWEYENLAMKGSLAKTWTAGYTLSLDRYSIDLTDIIRKNLPEIIGHEQQIKMAERILAGQGINNVLLIGDPGVGKDKIISALAKRSILGQSLPEINYRRFVELDMPSLLAEIEDEEQVETIIDEIFRESVTAGNVILVINNFHEYVGQSNRPGVVNISGVIAQYLQMPECQLIAITTYDGLHENVERNSSLASLFEKVEVPPLSKEETLLLLETMLPGLEKRYKRIVSYPALREIVDLCEKYMPASAFPEKAIKVLDDVAIYAADIPDEKVVLPKHVAKIIAEKTEVPVGEIESKEKEILLNLEGLIHKRLVNQEEAVKEVSQAMRRARSEVTIRKGPIGAFIFLGPTGVGKTETSKALADVYFGSEERMIRFDMSEFQDVKDIPRLIGSEDSPGLLTTAVRENPFSVLLLDEIEKADFNIRNLFLQVLDEGYIADNLGKKVYFKNTIIIATSNAGYKIILEAIKEKTPWQEVKKKIMDYIFQERIFQPEFINRFDAMVLFHPLTRENILDISGLMLSKLSKNLEEKGIKLVVGEALKREIAEMGYSEVFGAREMRRVIQEKIENVLASALIAGELKRGDQVEINPINFELIINSIIH